MAIFPGEPGLAGFIGAKDNENGGDNWSYKTSKLQSNRHHHKNQHPTFYFFYRLDAIPVAQPTVSKRWRDIWSLLVAITCRL